MASGRVPRGGGHGGVVGATRGRGCDTPNGLRRAVEHACRSVGRRGRRRYAAPVGLPSFAPLLVVEDVLVGRGGFVLLPAVPREGLPLCAGDCVDVLCDDEERREVEVLAL